MRTLLSIIVLTFATNAFADNGSSVYSCITDSDLLVRYNAYYGELTVSDKNGEILVDHDDGHNMQDLQLEVFPVIHQITVWHHEEPDFPVIFLSRRGDSGAYLGKYTDYDGVDHKLTCL